MIERSRFRVQGTYTALVTPFCNDAERTIDWKAFDTLVLDQVAGEVEGVVVSGSTGESPTLTPQEQLDLVRHAVGCAKGKVKVFAGTGSYSTRESIERSRAAEKEGVDGLMLVVPYYNRPTQDGLVEHFVTVASAVECPVILYNVPGRTGADLSSESFARICEKAGNVVALKDAAGSVVRTQETIRLLGSRIDVLTGDDALTLATVAAGGQGVISVASNLFPREVSDATRSMLDGKWEEGRRRHYDLLPIYEACFLESNPGPIKAALSLRKKIENNLRLPLVSVRESTLRAIEKSLMIYEKRA